MSTTAEKLNLLLNTKAAIKNALIEKGQEASDVFSTYPDKIRAIETCPDNALFVKDNKIKDVDDRDVTEETVVTVVPTQSAKIITPNTSEQTAVEAGVYTTGDIKVAAMPTAERATPTIAVNNVGKITATVVQETGYVNGGTQTAELFMETTDGGTVTPTTERQKVALAGTYNPSDISVMGDADLIPANIKSGVNIFGVDGTYVCPNDATAADTDIAKGKTAYVNGEKITGSVKTNTVDLSVFGELTGSSDRITMEYTFDEDTLFRTGTKLKNRAYLSEFGDATAADVVSGKTFTSSAGLKVAGTMTTETWVLTYEDDSTETKEVCIR